MLHEAATTQRTLHTLHYARSPFYCTVRIGSQTVESARVSLLTECGPCSPARSPGSGVGFFHLNADGRMWNIRVATTEKHHVFGRELQQLQC